MPVTVAPKRIELSTFRDGYMPDSPEPDIPPTGLPDVLNLLPDPSTDGLVLRPGFSLHSVIDPAGHDTTNYECHYLFFFEAIFNSARHKYLIAILTTNVDNVAANEMFVVCDLSTGTWTWKANFQAPHAGYEHWGGAASNVWYGGTGGITMYSWDPETDTFTANAASTDYKDWIAAASFSNNSTQRASDYAFKEQDKILYTNGKNYSAARGIRFDHWETGKMYRSGDKVSRWATHAPASSTQYWKSFRCIAAHESDSANAPATGANYLDVWDSIELDNPVADDGDTSDDWYFLPQPSQSIIGTFHGYRLFLRRHDNDNWAWIQYSSPFKPEKGVDIADLVFDPSDWSAATDENGDGGGWIPLREGDGDAIRALHTYGSYLIILKRWKSFVIAGINEATWNIRNLDPEKGSVQARSVCVHNGLVWFVTPSGELCLTDGTRVEPAPGADKVNNYINSRLDLMMASDDGVNWLPTLTSFNGYIWITLSNPSGSDDVTLVYHPETASFWKTNLPALDMTTGRIEGRQKMWFVPTVLHGQGVKPRVFQIRDDTTYTDISKTGSAASDISWSLRSPWFNFGVTRNERRLRRVWGLIKGGAGSGISVDVYRNYLTTAPATNVFRTVNGNLGLAEYIEGKVATTVGYAFGVKLSGTTPVNLILSGIGVDTEYVRSSRFHK